MTLEVMFSVGIPHNFSTTNIQTGLNNKLDNTALSDATYLKSVSYFIHSCCSSLFPERHTLYIDYRDKNTKQIKLGTMNLFSASRPLVGALGQ